MSLPRYKGVPRVTTITKTTEHRFEFGYADIQRLLRLPAGAKVTVEALAVEGIDREVKATFDLGTGSVILVATVTVQS